MCYIHGNLISFDRETAPFFLFLQLGFDLYQLIGPEPLWQEKV